jgi:hypothetical protein
VVLRACRYFGHTREYWWSTLTWPLYAELERELAENPPADRLIQIYFAAQKWWSPPDGEASRGREDGSDDDDEGVWECPLPDVTE